MSRGAVSCFMTSAVVMISSSLFPDRDPPRESTWLRGGGGGGEGGEGEGGGKEGKAQRGGEGVEERSSRREKRGVGRVPEVRKLSVISTPLHEYPQ